MSKIRIIVDGVTELDGDIGEWVTRPPDFVRDHLTPGSGMKPYMKVVAIAFADAVMADKSVVIDARSLPAGWVVQVEDM